MSQFRIYLLLLAASVGALLCVVALANIVIDPYDALGIRIPGINSKKLAVDDRPKFAKPYVALRVRPEAVILGSSRPAHAIRTTHRCWHPTSRSVFNLAVEGTTIYETLRFLQHAQAAGKLRLAVIEVDPNSFWAKPKTREGFVDQALLGPTQGMTTVLLTYAGALISWEMGSASLQTIAGQPSKPVLVDYDGRRNDISFERAIQRAGGQRELFRKIENIAYIQPLLEDGMPDASSLAAGSELSRPFEHFRAILDLARRNHVDVRFFLSPVHARQLEIYRAIGVSDEFANWKRRLVEVLEEEREASGSANAYPLWDFSRYSPITTEPVPTSDDTLARMAGYWETTHYKTTIGDRVLDQVLGCVADDDPSATGVRLTPHVVIAASRQFREEAARFRADQPHEVQDIESAVAAAVAERNRRRTNRS